MNSLIERKPKNPENKTKAFIQSNRRHIIKLW